MNDNSSSGDEDLECWENEYEEELNKEPEYDGPKPKKR